MISERQQFYLLHLTLEAQSANGIFTGFGDTTHDHLIFRLANRCFIFFRLNRKHCASSQRDNPCQCQTLIVSHFLITRDIEKSLLAL